MTTPPDTAQLLADSQSVRDHTARREDILAGRGAFPTAFELSLGLPFYRGDMMLDAKTWLESQTLTDFVTPKILKALKLAIANTSRDTLRAVTAIYGTGETDTHHRIDLYCAWLGDKPARERTIRRGLEDVHTHNSVATIHSVALALGLLGLRTRASDPEFIKTSEVDAVLDRGHLMLVRIRGITERLADAEAGPEKLVDGDTRDRMAGALAAIAVMQEDRAEIPAAHFEDSIPDEYLGTPPGPPTDWLVVPAMDSKTGHSNALEIRKSWSRIAGKRLPLVQINDVAGIAAGLVKEWPHAQDVIHTILGDLAHGGPVYFRPTLLFGEPGSGKTALLREIGDRCGLATEAYNLGGQSDSSVMGTSSQWATAREHAVLQVVKRTEQGNLVFVWDEVEKAAGSRHNGSAQDAMLPMLERDQARRFRDLCLEVECDLSMVSHFATANSVEGIPAPLRDRMRVLRMPDPTWKDLGTLTKQIVDRIARDRGVDARWFAPLAEDEMDVLRTAWPGGSLRRLRQAIEVLLDGRDMILGRA